MAGARDLGPRHDARRGQTSRELAAMARPQDLLVTILGDYHLGEKRTLWSAALVRLLGDLGFSPAAARMALSRLGATGLITRTRQGRTTHYRLTDHGRRVLEEGQRRIFNFGLQDEWDGTWTMLSYSIPEELRAVRQGLRKRLRFLGFTLLPQGLWLAPRDRVADVEDLLNELEVRAHAQLFLGSPVEVEEVAELIRASWQLDRIDGLYDDFLKDYGAYAPDRARGGLSERKAFVLRTRLMQAYRQFPLRDPELPDELVRRPDRRTQAIALFHALWRDLAAPAERHVSSLGPRDVGAGQP
jgi:phenylacetic acid degradation operon negative regulatory protein